MRLWILSDLHIEGCVWDMPSPAPDYDVLIAAGDIHDPASKGVAWLAERAGGKPVIYVPGNHEWYAHNQPFTVKSETQAARELAAKSGVHFLMDEAVVIDGVRFLCATLWTDWDLSVVVTHHLPHPRSVSERFKDSPLNPAFASDLSELVESCGAALWVHGHTHDSFDYRVGSTRIVCNPKGYGPKGEGAPIENRAFDPMFVVEV